MNKSEKELLLNKYEELQGAVNHWYDQGSPAIETSRTEAKVELIKEILTVLNIPFKD